MESKDLKVFYDGGCVVCNYEIDFYKKKDLFHRIDWVDIHNSSFSAEKYGLDPLKVRERFHSITKDGDILDGVDSFLKIWKILQCFTVLVIMAEWKPTRYILDLGYVFFTKVRPYLPRRNYPECSDGSCAIPESNLSKTP